MYPPLFSTVSQDAVVQAIFGSSPVRVYPFGDAPPNPTKPYAVFQSVSGAPALNVSTTPDIDSWTIQVDVYATTVTESRNGAEALRDAIEPVAHIVSWRGEERDPETRDYRYSFDVDWWEHRDNQS